MHYAEILISLTISNSSIWIWYQRWLRFRNNDTFFLLNFPLFCRVPYPHPPSLLAAGPFSAEAPFSTAEQPSQNLPRSATYMNSSSLKGLRPPHWSLFNSLAVLKSLSSKYHWILSSSSWLGDHRPTSRECSASLKSRSICVRECIENGRT